MKTKTIVSCALFAAVMCVFSVITIPIGPVPITLGFFAVMLTAVIIGAKKGVIAVAVYLALGCAGLPVFSGFKSGFTVLLGPTGGYAWSYIIMALVIGLMTKNLPENRFPAILKLFLACLAGGIISYAAGTAQFMVVMNAGLQKALTLCVIPFIPFDIAKAIVAATAGYEVRRRLTKANLIQ